MFYTADYNDGLFIHADGYRKSAKRVGIFQPMREEA